VLCFGRTIDDNRGISHQMPDHPARGNDMKYTILVGALALATSPAAQACNWSVKVQQMHEETLTYFVPRGDAVTEFEAGGFLCTASDAVPVGEQPESVYDEEAVLVCETGSGEQIIVRASYIDMAVVGKVKQPGRLGIGRGSDIVWLSLNCR